MRSGSAVELLRRGQRTAGQAPGRAGKHSGRANINRPAPWIESWSGTLINLHARLCSWENLLLAYQLASRGKRGHANVAAFEYSLEENLLRLQEELEEQTYRPGTYQSFYIHEPKRRLISAAPFRDRVVHHALCNLIEPPFERSFISDSYANRVGKGTHRALNRAQGFARRFPYVLQCDIQQYFPSIDHEILKTMLGRKIDDPRVMGLVERILESGQGVLAEQYDMVYFPGDDLLSSLRRRGLPIGNLTSQFWGNVYLSGFDHFVKRELGCRGYLRYVDDFLLFAADKQTLWEWKRAVQAGLTGLRLVMHPGEHPRPVSEGFPFLGFVVFPQQRRLKQRKGIYYLRKLRAMLRSCQQGEMPRAAVNASLQGWVNHVRYGNTTGLRKAAFGTGGFFF
jgi:hypothetical protein